MEIKVLGSGCPKCKRLEELTRQAIATAGLHATVAKVTDIDAILAYPILSTPGLVIDERLVASGRLPRPDEIVGWLLAAQAATSGARNATPADASWKGEG